MTSEIKKLSLFDVIVLFDIIYELIPFVRYHSPHGLSLLIIVALIGIMILKDGGAWFWTTLKKLLPLYIFEFIAVFASVLSFTDQSAIMSIRYFLHLLVIPLAICFYVDNGLFKQLKYVLIVTFSSIIITSITTYFGNIKIPGASRLLAAGSMVEAEGLSDILWNLNVGGFGFVYTIALLIPFVVWLIKRNRNTTLKIYQQALIVSFVVLVGLTIIATEYTTALIVYVLSLCLFFIPRNTNPRTLILIGVILLLMIEIIIPVVAHILARSASSTESVIFAERLNDMSLFISGEQTEGADFDSRREVFSKSWQNFIDNPIFGSGNNGGGHSYILDRLSQYGLIGLLLLVLLFKRLYSIVIKPFEQYECFSFILILFLFQIFLAFMNTAILYDVFVLVLMPTLCLMKK